MYTLLMLYVALHAAPYFHTHRYANVPCKPTQFGAVSLES